MTWKYAAAVQNNGPNYFAVTTGKWGAPTIAMVFQEDHARLIAAAPATAAERDRLRAALDRLLFAIDACGGLSVGIKPMGLPLQDAIDDARAAIAKAEGR